MKNEDFAAIYARRERAQLDDAYAEADKLVQAVERIRRSAGSDGADQDLAAGKLFEVAGEIASAEIAYRRSSAMEARVRHVIVLIKQGRHHEAIDAGNELFVAAPDTIIRSLVYEGPLSLCSVLGDAHRLAGDVATAAGFYREAARLDGGTPYAVSQAALCLTAAGQSEDANHIAAQHPDAIVKRVAAIMHLGTRTNDRLPLIRQLAERLARVGAAESMPVSKLDLVGQR